MNKLMLLMLTAGMIGVVILTPSAVAAPAGECVTAVVDSPFRIPDGRLYPAGPLTLCDSGAFSPVDTLHRIVVGGSTIGVFRSRRHDAESEQMLAPEIVFNRESDGSLQLIGYTVPTSGHAVAYRMRGASDLWQATARRQPGAAVPVASIVAVVAIH